MFQFKKPIDFHIHLRDNEMLPFTLSQCTTYFSGAIVMPNLEIPIDTMDKLINYRNRINKHIPPNTTFTPYMTLYITKDLTPETLELANKDGNVIGCKLYPCNATTNSSYGFKSVFDYNHIYAKMEELDLVLLIHGELPNGNEIDFVSSVMPDLVHKFPKLRIVLEHISTSCACNFIKKHPNVGATITPHHLYFTKDDVARTPHLQCCPPIQSIADKEALIELATSGASNVFVGTDSAPHTSYKKDKYNSKGIYNTPVALSIYLEIFEKANKLENFEKFIYTNGINFYKLNNSHHNPTNLTYKKQLFNHPTYYHIDTTLDDNNTTLDDTNIKDKTKVVYSMTQNLTWSRVSEDNCSF